MGTLLVLRAEAKKLGLKYCNTGKPCNHGHLSNRFVSSKRCIECASVYAKNNVETVRANWHRWVADNRDKENFRLRTHRLANIEHERKRVEVWRKANLDKHVAKEARRRAKKLQAMPVWVDQDAIQDKYEFCKLWSGLMGRDYEVDHIVPLQGKLASGLHVAANLRVITALENRTKSNKLTYTNF